MSSFRTAAALALLSMGLCACKSTEPEGSPVGGQPKLLYECVATGGQQIKASIPADDIIEMAKTYGLDVNLEALGKKVIDAEAQAETTRIVARIRTEKPSADLLEIQLYFLAISRCSNALDKPTYQALTELAYRVAINASVPERALVPSSDLATDADAPPQPHARKLVLYINDTTRVVSNTARGGGCTDDATLKLTASVADTSSQSVFDLEVPSGSSKLVVVDVSGQQQEAKVLLKGTAICGSPTTHHGGMVHQLDGIPVLGDFVLSDPELQATPGLPFHTTARFTIQGKDLNEAEYVARISGYARLIATP